MSETVVVLAQVSAVVGEVKVAVGDKVNENDVLAVQIVTKTEINIIAPKAGTVQEIASKGTNLQEGQIAAKISV